MNKFNVLVWDINCNYLKTYDVLPYFRERYKKCKVKNRPITKEQWVDFVKGEGMRRFWGQCQYEIQISAWPPHPIPEKDKHIKIDVWQQIENNFDIVVDLLMSEIPKKK